MSSKSVNRFVKFVLGTAFICAAAFVVNCGGGSSQNISPYGGYGITSCVPGQVGCTTTCVAGQVGCTTGGYAVYAGNIGSLNNSLASQIIYYNYGVQNYCLGGCYNGSTVQLTMSGGVVSVSIFFGSYVVSGQGTVTPVNNNVGSLVQASIPGGTITITSNSESLTSGTVGNIPSIPIQFNGQQLGNTSLLLQVP